MSDEKGFPPEELHWKSAITQIKQGSIRVRGYDLTELVGRLTFTEMLWLVTMGEIPSPRTTRVLDAILVSAAEGGAQSPSVLTARTVAGCGAPITAAIAAGALAISKYHGGAVEGAMRQLMAIREEVRSGAMPMEEACRQAVRQRLQRKERLGGFGHRVHKEIDPRVEQLFRLTREAGFEGEYLDLTLAIGRALEAETGKRLPPNIDAGYAAILCELGFPPELSNALWFFSRFVGIMAHAYEEQSRMRPRRYIHPIDWEYDGPPERELTGGTGDGETGRG